MDDLVSQNTSRGTTSLSSLSSFSGDSYWISSDEDRSVTDLTHHLDRYTLRSPRHVEYLQSPPSGLSDYHSSRTFRDTSPPQDHLHLVRQQRQSTSRRQCSPAHLSRVSMLVEDMLRDDPSCCTTSNSSLQGNNRSSGASRQSSRGFERPTPNTLHERVSDRSTPTCCSTPMTVAPLSEYGDPVTGRCSKPQHLYKVVKEPRHIQLCQGNRRKPVIEKDIRLRRRMAG